MPLGNREGVEAEAASQDTGRRVTLTFRRWDGEGAATMNSSSTPIAIPSARILSRVGIASAVFFMGLALFLAAGFASPSAIHNATHDMRHSLGLPCH
jgi:cobalt transporter subunit CbtB